MVGRALHVITVLSADGRYGGPQTVARTLRARRGDDLWGGACRVDLDLDGDRPGERRFRAIGASAAYSRLAAPGLWWALWRDQRGAGRRAAGHELVHLHTGPELSGLMALLIVRVRRSRFVAQPHGMFSYPSGSSRARIVARVFIPLLRHARAVVALTDVEREALIGYGLDPSRVTVIANGVDLDTFDRRAAVVTEDADRSARPERPIVAFVGRLHPRKHPERFTAAAAALARRGCPARFVMVGADQGAEAIARASDPDGVVEFLGALPADRARHVMATAAVAVMCSDVEPFGLVAIEAMAAGAAVVITDSCDLAGELGLAGAALVTSKTPAAIAAGIATLLDDPSRAQRQRASARALVERRYSMVVIGAQWDALYRGVVDDDAHVVTSDGVL